MQKDYRWFGVEPRLVVAIGVIAIQWARIEWTLQKIAIGILGSDVSKSIALVGNLGFRALEQYLSALIHAAPTHGPEFVRDLSTLLGESRRLYGIASSLMGNTWPDALSEREYIGQSVTLKGSKVVFEEIWTEKQINLVVEELLDLADALRALGKRYQLFGSFEAWKKEQISKKEGAERLLARTSMSSPALIEILKRLKGEMNEWVAPAPHTGRREGH